MAFVCVFRLIQKYIISIFLSLIFFAAEDDKMEMLLITNPDEVIQKDGIGAENAAINALFELMDLESERNSSDSLIVSWIRLIDEWKKKFVSGN